MFLLSRRVRFRYSLRKHLYCDARKVLSRPGSKERAELGAERVGRWWRVWPPDKVRSSPLCSYQKLG